MQLLRLKYLFLSAGFMLMTVLIGCKKGDGSLDYGFAYIYMPQSLQSGNTGIVYTVPSGYDSATYNYKIDTPNNKLDIMLGVLRSGKLPNDAFSVDIITNADTINKAIADGSLVQNPDAGDNIILLPEGYYTLPQTVNVPNGQYQATFYLSVDINQLKTLSGKKAAVAVSLTNPSKYQLNSANSETIVLINVDALQLP